MFLVRKTNRVTFNTETFSNSNKKKSKNDNIIILTKKGNTEKIDIDRLKETIVKLSRNKHKRIEYLSGDLKKNFDQLVTYVNLLHGTKHYTLLLNTLNTYFGNMENVQPFTIGGYVGGCTIQTNLDDDSCSPLCSGSVKYDNSICDHPVITAKYNGKSFTFTSDDQTGSKIANIYVEYTSLRSFPGFDINDKNWLKQKGFHKVFIYGTKNYRKYNNLYPNNGEPITIEEIKPRVGKVHSYPEKFNTSNILLIGFVLIIVLVLLYFWATSDSKKKRTYRYFDY